MPAESSPSRLSQGFGFAPMTRCSLAQIALHPRRDEAIEEWWTMTPRCFLAAMGMLAAGGGPGNLLKRESRHRVSPLSS